MRRGLLLVGGLGLLLLLKRFLGLLHFDPLLVHGGPPLIVLKKLEVHATNVLLLLFYGQARFGAARRCRRRQALHHYSGAIGAWAAKVLRAG